jgi:hypothetical protein
MKKYLLTCTCAFLLLGFSFAVNAQKKGSVTYHGNVIIKDFVSDGTNTFLLSVTGDGINSNYYRDYRLPNADPCVTAFGEPSFLMYPQRTADCQPNTRHVKLYIPQATYNDANFPAVCKTVFTPDRDGTAYFVHAYRMYFSNLYGSPTRKNPEVWTDARFGFYCGSNVFSIQPDGMFKPEILSSDGKRRRISNLGSSAIPANLFYPQDGNFYPTGVAPFPFWFDITTVFTAQ